MGNNSSKTLQDSSESSCKARIRNWCVKSVNGKVIAEWEVDLKESQTLKSPTFWLSGSTEWCMEITRGEHLSLSFHLLSPESDPLVQAELLASVTWAGVGIAEKKTLLVTLTKQETFVLFSCMNVPLDHFWIRGEVTIHSESQKLYTEACSLSEDLGALLNSGDLSDIVLFAGGTKLKAHRALLSARSSVFAAMLCHNTREAEMGCVEIQDVEPDTLREVLQYIYTGRAPNMEGMAGELLAAADKYSLLELKNLCGEEMARSLTVDNAAAAGVIAVRHSSDLLRRAVACFIMTNSVGVLASDGWAAAVRQHPDVVIEISRLIAGEFRE